MSEKFKWIDADKPLTEIKWMEDIQSLTIAMIDAMHIRCGKDPDNLTDEELVIENKLHDKLETALCDIYGVYDYQHHM